jgi:hypothetical protein
MAMIPVLVSENEGSAEGVQEGTLGTLRSHGRTLGGEKSVVRNLDVGRLKSSVNTLMAQLADVFADLKAVGDYKLAEVTISVEVSAEGNVILVGKAGVSGGISLKFEP